MKKYTFLLALIAFNIMPMDNNTPTVPLDITDFLTPERSSSSASSPDREWHDDPFNQETYLFALQYLKPLCTQEFDRKTVQTMPDESKNKLTAISYLIKINFSAARAAFLIKEIKALDNDYGDENDYYESDTD